MTRFLGVDYGTKYVGLAISDEGGEMAFPLAALANTKKLLDEIVKICGEKGVGEIVLGESRDFQGGANPVQEKIAAFKKELEATTNLPVHFEPEFLTSAQARNLGGAGNHSDASAAALILQGYLERKHKLGNN